MARTSADPVPAPPGSFPEEFGRALQGLRAALIELLASVPQLPARPYPMARFLGINKNLAWRVAQVIGASNPAEAVRHVPGEVGAERLLDAFSKHSAPEREVQAVREALEAFHRMASTHAGDRASLELMLGSLATEHQGAAPLEASGKLAFQGNSATLGVRVRTHFALNIVAPGAEDPTVIDVATIGGLIGFRRLRPDVTWPLMRMHAFAEEGESRPGSLVGGEGPPLLTPFCSHPHTELARREEANSLAYEVPPGPVGQTAESDWVFGLQSRSLGSVYSEDEAGVLEFQYRMSTPAEVGICDLLVHRDLPLAGPPRTKFVSLMSGIPSFPMWQHARHTIPLSDGLEDLGCPAVLASRHLPRYREIVDLACRQMGWDPSEFRGFRLTLAHPPIPSAPILVYPQPRPPA